MLNFSAALLDKSTEVGESSIPINFFSGYLFARNKIFLPPPLPNSTTYSTSVEFTFSSIKEYFLSEIFLPTPNSSLCPKRFHLLFSNSEVGEPKIYSSRVVKV